MNLFPMADALVINVNLSARQLERKDLVEQVRQILTSTGLNPRCLKLEMTESVIMSNAEEAIETVCRLGEMGVRVSIDGFWDRVLESKLPASFSYRYFKGQPFVCKPYRQRG